MFNTWHDKEFLLGITTAIHNHAAMLTNDDSTVLIGIMSLGVSLIVGTATVYLIGRQAKIMEQQNKISLFEKRYAIVRLLDSFTGNINSLKDKLRTLDNKPHTLQTTEILSLLFCKSNANPLSDARLPYSEFVENTMNNANELIVTLHRVKFFFDLTKRDEEEIDYIKKMIEYFLKPIHEKNRELNIKYINDKFSDHYNKYPNSLLLKNLEKQLYITKPKKYNICKKL